MSVSDRHRCPACGQPTSGAERPIIVGSLRLDPLSGVAFIGDRRLHLAPSEFKLVELLARYPNRPHPRWAMMEPLRCSS